MNKLYKWQNGRAAFFGGQPCVLSFVAPDDLLFLSSVRVKRFEKPTKEWAVFIINNRNRDFDVCSSPLSNRDNKFDIVYGPVANDDLTTLIQRYHHGFIDEKILLQEMEYVSPTEQYSFHTEAAIALLKKSRCRMAQIDQIGFLTELNIQEIIAYIAEDSGIEYDEAIDRFYHSATCSKLTDKETGLYRESAAYLYELYKAELANGKLTQIDD